MGDSEVLTGRVTARRRVLPIAVWLRVGGGAGWPTDRSQRCVIGLLPLEHKHTRAGIVRGRGVRVFPVKQAVTVCMPIEGEGGVRSHEFTEVGDAAIVEIAGEAMGILDAEVIAGAVLMVREGPMVPPVPIPIQGMYIQWLMSGEHCTRRVRPTVKEAEYSTDSKINFIIGWETVAELVARSAKHNLDSRTTLLPPTNRLLRCDAHCPGVARYRLLRSNSSGNAPHCPLG